MTASTIASITAPNDANAGQLDTDNDTVGDVCDPDDDGDGVDDGVDVCPLVSDPNQYDNDNDFIGDECDTDDDNDGELDVTDNCQFEANADQSDSPDGDGIGDVCDLDDDNDGYNDDVDNCPLIANGPADSEDQVDTDNDGVGDICDPTPTGGSITITGTLRGTNAANCNYNSTLYAGETVTITNGSDTYVTTSDSNGDFSFTNYPAGNWSFTTPVSPGGDTLTSVAAPSCLGGSPTMPVQVTVGAGASVDVTLGYK